MEIQKKCENPVEHGVKNCVDAVALRKNKNRGYMQLRVWQDAIEFYKQNRTIFRKWPFELRRASSQAIASADSIHHSICPHSESSFAATAGPSV